MRAAIKERGTSRAGSSNQPWSNAEGRMGEPQTCSAPTHSGGARGPSPEPRKPQQRHRFISALPSQEPESKDHWIALTHFLLYYNCYYLQGRQQRKRAGRAVPLQHKEVPNNPLYLFACMNELLSVQGTPQISSLPPRERGMLLCTASLCTEAQQKPHVV